MKAVKTKLGETNPGRVEAFEKGAQSFAKKIVANFKDYEFVCIPRSLFLLGYTPSYFVWSYAVHWRVHEPRRHGCPPQLPRGWCHPCVPFSL